jgi:hypothetical protein
MRILLDRPLSADDVTIINNSGIDYDIEYLKAMAPQDLGWRDHATGAVIPTPNHRVIFNIRIPSEESFIRLHFTDNVKVL